MKHFVLPAIALFFLASCQPGAAKESKDSTSTATDSTAMVGDSSAADKAHTTQNSLDWSGMYKGVLPCADCEGIETVLLLNADNTYLLQTKYLNKGDAPAIEKTGGFTWNTEGNTVILSGIENAPNQYFVAENKIIQLDMAGQKIEGKLAEKYVLVKQ